MASSAARHVVDDAREALPDLNGLIVLLPDPHALAPFCQHLAAAAKVPVLLPPQVTTLAQWARTVDLAAPVTPLAARELLLHQTLSGRGWLAGSDLFAMAAELAALFDQLTRWRVPLTADADAFAVALARAYRAREGASLRFEARLVHELWYASQATASDLAPEAAYQQRLSELAKAGERPLYLVGRHRLAPAEDEFLARYAERAPVVELVPSDDPAGPAARVMAAAWPAQVNVPLAERAEGLASALPLNPLAGRLTFVGASSLEEEARAIDAAVRRALRTGLRSIAVVVLDRVVARRARALLERAAILVRDEAGWALSTTSAATVLARLFDVAAGDGYHQHLLDLLKSPFVFADLPRAEHHARVARLERLLRARTIPAGLARMRATAQEQGDASVAQMLARVIQAVGHLAARRRPLTGWIEAVQVAFGALAATDALAADAAGAQVLEVLATLALDLAGVEHPVSAADFRHWLGRAFESATFRDRAIDSPVLFTHLGATRCRSFDTVVLAGCDAAHLPGNDSGALFFNQGVRAELGLPTRADALRDLELDLGDLIAGSGEVVITWQRSADGEGNLLSPQIERLRTLVELAWGEPDHTDAEALRAWPPVRCPTESEPPPPAGRPAPQAAPELVPDRVSAAAYQELVDCPYRFRARRMLRLKQEDEVQEEVDNRDWGNRLHALLADFHTRHPLVSALAPDAAQAALEATTQEAFRDALAIDALAGGWIEAWRRAVPHYLAWQRDREAAGWQWRATEAHHELAIESAGGRRLTIVGRLDRLDRSAAGLAVLDYKTTRPQALRDRLAQPGEDVQLAVYVLLGGDEVTEAAFVSIRADGIEQIPLVDGPQALALANRERLAALVDALHAGAAMPAHGAEHACDRCEMEGLCRRSHWA